MADNDLHLWSKGKAAPLQATWKSMGGGSFPSQRLFRTSPDGRFLGYLDETSSALHVRGARGKETVIEKVSGRDWRFSPDGKRLAALAGDAPRLKVLELDTGKVTDLGETAVPDRVEWVSGGVVVHEMQPNRLVFVPLEGERRVLVKRNGIDRFATAGEGTQVYFVRPEGDGETLYRVDVTGGKPVEVGTMSGSILNGEVAPDGSRAAFSTDHGLYTTAGKGIHKIDRDGAVSTIWFSADGARLLYASPGSVRVMDGDKTVTLDGGAGWYQSARFSGDQVLAVANQEVVRWDPASGKHETLATAPQGTTFLAADAFGEDLVTWELSNTRVETR